jgi:Matrixin
MKKLLLSALLVVGTACGVGNASIHTDGSTMTYEEFLTSGLYQEESGEFITNGDEMVEDEAGLREYYNQHIAVNDDQTSTAQALAIATSGGKDVKWSATQARNLTYCVSTKFGTNYNAVVSAMASATAAWSAVANVAFVHVTSKDSACTASTTGVVFDVNPVNVNGQYLARSFFPNTTRKSRNIKIDNTSFSITTPNLTLTGILRHELGHTIGFRHEHTRPEAGTCFEDNNWRALTTYDSSSVMHYPQCNGTGNWSLTLTTRDAQGARAVYP